MFGRVNFKLSCEILVKMPQNLRLFLDSVMSSPISIIASSRYALINPKNYGSAKDSTLFALVGGFDEELHVTIDGGF